MLLDEHVWIHDETIDIIRISSPALGRRRHDTTSVQEALKDSQASVLRCGRLTSIHDSRNNRISYEQSPISIPRIHTSNTMSVIDLSLPKSVPDMARYQDRPMTLNAFAIYNLIDDEKELSDLIEECHSQCPRDDYIYLREAPGITSLESLIDFHLDTTVPDSFDPNLFLVVTDLDWQRKGLMIVTLDDDEGRPDKFTLKAADSGILLINLQIGNTDWYEAKENYELTDEDDVSNTQPGTLTLTSPDALSN